MVYWWGKAAKNEQRYKKQKAKNINRLIVNSKAKKRITRDEVKEKSIALMNDPYVELSDLT